MGARAASATQAGGRRHDRPTQLPDAASYAALNARGGSPEHRKPLIDAGQDAVGHHAKHRSEKGASSEEIRQKPVEVDCQLLRCLGIVPVRQRRNTGDVPLYAQEHDTHAQEDGAHGEVDAEEFSAPRGAIRYEEAGDDERARGAREERRAAIDDPKDDNHRSRRRAAPFAAYPGPRSPAPAAQAETGAAGATLVDPQRHFGCEGTSSISSTRSWALVSWTH
jgi:hypothetical protein